MGSASPAVAAVNSRDHTIVKPSDAHMYRMSAPETHRGGFKLSHLGECRDLKFPTGS